MFPHIRKITGQRVFYPLIIVKSNAILEVCQGKSCLEPCLANIFGGIYKRIQSQKSFAKVLRGNQRSIQQKTTGRFWRKCCEHKTFCASSAPRKSKSCRASNVLLCFYIAKQDCRANSSPANWIRRYWVVSSVIQLPMQTFCKSSRKRSSQFSRSTDSSATSGIWARICSPQRSVICPSR